jgi:divalent metal cation (Fe/Co/Zn/Cd) transporter
VSFVRHAKAPELPVVLLEDVGALIGLVFALFGVGLTIITGNPVFDAIGTLMIGTLLVIIAIVLGIETKSLLVGEGATEADYQRIVGAITGGPEVEKLIHIKTLYLGPDELLVAAKLGFTSDASLAHVAADIDRVEARIREAVPAARVIYLEPDVYRPSEDPTPPTSEFVIKSTD